jgi:hypothetical protein
MTRVGDLCVMAHVRDDLDVSAAARKNGRHQERLQSMNQETLLPPSGVLHPHGCCTVATQKTRTRAREAGMRAWVGRDPEGVQFGLHRGQRIRKSGDFAAPLTPAFWPPRLQAPAPLCDRWPLER